MNYLTYFRLVLILSVVLPVILLGLDWRLNQIKDEAGLHGGIPLYIVLIPYLLFVALLWWITIGKTKQAFAKIVYLSPVMLIPFSICTFEWTNYLGNSGQYVLRGMSVEWVGLALITVSFGYGYILIAYILFKLWTKNSR